MINLTSITLGSISKLKFCQFIVNPMYLSVHITHFTQLYYIDYEFPHTDLISTIDLINIRMVLFIKCLKFITINKNQMVALVD